MHDKLLQSRSNDVARVDPERSRKLHQQTQVSATPTKVAKMGRRTLFPPVSKPTTNGADPEPPSAAVDPVNVPRKAVHVSGFTLDGELILLPFALM